MKDRLEELTDLIKSLQAEVGKRPFDEILITICWTIREELAYLRESHRRRHSASE